MKTLPTLSVDELNTELNLAVDEIENARYAAQLARRDLAQANVRFSEVKRVLGEKMRAQA